MNERESVGDHISGTRRLGGDNVDGGMNVRFGKRIMETFELLPIFLQTSRCNTSLYHS